VLCVALGTLALGTVTIINEGQSYYQPQYAQVGQDGSLVRRVNRVRGVGRIRSEAMVPFSSESGTLGNLVDGGGHGLDIGVYTTIAYDVVAVHVLNRLEAEPVSMGSSLKGRKRRVIRHCKRGHGCR